jgi:hypothetical protein
MKDSLEIVYFAPIAPIYIDILYVYLQEDSQFACMGEKHRKIRFLHMYLDIIYKSTLLFRIWSELAPAPVQLLYQTLFFGFVYSSSFIPFHSKVNSRQFPQSSVYAHWNHIHPINPSGI